MTGQFADYELVEQLGAGNHGTYWKALAPSRLGLPDEVVALKVLTSLGSADDFRRAANELRLLHSLRHPNLVELLDAGNSGGSLYIATRWYGGTTLAGAPSDAVPAAVAAMAVADVAEAAHAMHEVGVAHRDIKPGNVVLDGERGRLADLGLAQLVGPERTVGGGPIGSLGFIDPTVVRGDDASRESDIFALAATLHTAVTGQGLFGEIPTGSVLEACRHVLRTAPQISGEVSPPVHEIMERALRTAGAGFSTAEAFAQDLRSALAATSDSGESA